MKILSLTEYSYVWTVTLLFPFQMVVGLQPGTIIEQGTADSATWQPYVLSCLFLQRSTLIQNNVDLHYNLGSQGLRC